MRGKEKTQKAFALLLAIVMVLVLAAGCGGREPALETKEPIDVPAGEPSREDNIDARQVEAADTAGDAAAFDSRLVGEWYGSEGGFHGNSGYIWSFGNEGRFAYLFSAYEPPQGDGSIESSVRERFMQGAYRVNGSSIECYDIRVDDYFARGDSWRYFPDRDPDLLAGILLTTPLIESEGIDDFTLEYEFTDTNILRLVVDCGEFPDRYDMDFECVGDSDNRGVAADEHDSDIPSLENVNEPSYIILAADKLNVVSLEDLLVIITQENRTTEYRWYFDVSGDDILEVVADEYKWDANPRGADGAGGERIITFRSIATGEATVEMALMREIPDEPVDIRDGSASQIVKYPITVK